VELGII